MSTRSIIARSTGEGTFKGVYHHSDGYPTGLGEFLVESYRGHFRKIAGHAAFERMLAYMIDEHPAGWASIFRKDFKLKPGYSTEIKPREMSWEDYQKTVEYRRPKCFCHGKRQEPAELYDEKSDCHAEWAYVFEVINEGDEAKNVLHILYPERIEENIVWKEAGRVDLDDDTVKIDWEHIECGEKLERCSHYAWVHGLTSGDSNLSTQAFLGQRALTHRDAIGFVIDGKEYAATGSGGNSNYYNSHGKSYPRDAWISSVKARNGKRLDLPTANILKDGSFVPYPGVEWILPSTANAPATRRK